MEYLVLLLIIITVSNVLDISKSGKIEIIVLMVEKGYL